MRLCKHLFNNKIINALATTVMELRNSFANQLKIYFRLHFSWPVCTVHTHIFLIFVHIGMDEIFCILIFTKWHLASFWTVVSRTGENVIYEPFRRIYIFSVVVTAVYKCIEWLEHNKTSHNKCPYSIQKLNVWPFTYYYVINKRIKYVQLCIVYNVVHVIGIETLCKFRDLWQLKFQRLVSLFNDMSSL